jgi:hypothetical protein
VRDLLASIWQGREVDAEADFFNTASVTLSTDTPGVTIEAQQPALVPTSGGPGLVALSLLLTASARRLRNR